MLRSNKSNKSSIIVEKLDTMRLSATERAEALAALAMAERMVDGFASVCAAAQRLLARAFLKPGLGA